MLLDVTRTVKRTLQNRLPTGVDRVCLTYVAHYRHRAVPLIRWAGRWVVLKGRDGQRLFDAVLGSKVDRAWLWGAIGRHVLDTRAQLKRAGIILNVGHSGLETPAYARFLRKNGLHSVFMLHDLIPVDYPEYARPGEAERHRRRLQTLYHARGLIYNSLHTADRFADYSKAQGRAPPSGVVAHLGVQPLPAPLQQRPLAGPYFLMLGTVEPRKNHLLILQAWRAMAGFGSDIPKLVVIGQRGWECEQVVDLLERSQALQGHVLELGRCTDVELATWLHHAQALLFPSFAEGYGLPLIEALNAGTPVIASRLPVFHELAGDIPEYLDPLDGPGWIRAIRDYTAVDSPRRQAQLTRLRQWRPPTWEGHFARVDAFLEACLHT